MKQQLNGNKKEEITVPQQMKKLFDNIISYVLASGKTNLQANNSILYVRDKVYHRFGYDMGEDDKGEPLFCFYVLEKGTGKQGMDFWDWLNLQELDSKINTVEMVRGKFSHVIDSALFTD